MIAVEKDWAYAYMFQLKWGQGWAAGQVTGTPIWKGHINNTGGEGKVMSGSHNSTQGKD